MRWQELFADLEAQAQAWNAAETAAEVADRTRAELASVSLSARLHHAVGRAVRISVAGAGEISGRFARVGADWALVTTPDEVLVATSAVLAWWNLPDAATGSAGIAALVGRTRMTAVLRAVARDRSAVVVTGRDGQVIVGTPDRVGSDWVDLAVHARGATARRAEVRARATIALGAVATVSRSHSGWD